MTTPLNQCCILQSCVLGTYTADPEIILLFKALHEVLCLKSGIWLWRDDLNHSDIIKSPSL